MSCVCSRGPRLVKVVTNPSIVPLEWNDNHIEMYKLSPSEKETSNQ